MEAVATDPATIIAWAQAAKVGSTKLSIINQARMTFELPPFRVAKGVFGAKGAPITEHLTESMLKLSEAREAAPEPVKAPVQVKPHLVASGFAGLSAFRPPVRAVALPAAEEPDEPEVTDIVPPEPAVYEPEPEPEPMPLQAQTSVIPAPKIERNLRGLVDALFDEIDAMRDGTGSAERVRTVVAVSGRINALLNTEMKFRKTAGLIDTDNTRMKEITG